MPIAAFQPRASGDLAPRDRGRDHLRHDGLHHRREPKILEAAGIPFGPSMVATILSAALGTLLMGLWANRPFAIAPYMGQNAFIAYTVVQGMGHTWQTALGAIFVSGVAFTVLALFRTRAWLAESIPEPADRIRGRNRTLPDVRRSGDDGSRRGGLGRDAGRAGRLPRPE